MIHINADIGELPAHLDDGAQRALLEHLTAVNIACGGHAGTPETMRISVAQAQECKLHIGAHPGYPDPENFGRVEMQMPADAVARTVYEQIQTLARYTGEIRHIKPHGALYNQAARDPALALAIARGVEKFSRHVTLVGLAGSRMLEVFADCGFAVAAEAFADRRYNADGSLVARTRPDALIEDPREAAAQALRMAHSGRIQTICVHGDTPGAAAIARAVAHALGVYFIPPT